MPDLYDTFTAKLLERDEGPVRNGGEWTTAHCPAHDDGENGSLSFKRGDKPGVLVTNCNGEGCEYWEILDAVGLDSHYSADGDAPRPSINGHHPRLRHVDGDVTYWYNRNAAGELRYVKKRFPDPETGRKRYATIKKAQDYEGAVKEPLFATDHLKFWVHPSGTLSPVVLTEGEKDACALIECGVPAVGTTCGASATPADKPLSELKGRRVTLWPDYHDKGRDHMRRTGERLRAMGIDVRWFEWPSPEEGGGAADHPDVQNEDWRTVSRLIKSTSVPFKPPPPESVAIKLGSRADAVINDVRLARENGGVLGMPTGIRRLDKLTGGLVKTEATLVAAYTGVGKSLLCAMAAMKAAMEGHTVLLCSSEMHPDEYAKRLGCYLSRVDYFRARDGNLSDEDERKLHTSTVALNEFPLWFCHQSGLTPDDIRKAIEAVQPDLVVVDHLHTMEPNKRVQGDFDRMGAISGAVTGFKLEYGVAVLSAAQFNKNSNYRRGEDSKVPPPVLSDISGNNKVVADHNAVIAVHRPDQYLDDVESSSEPVLLRILKHRAGRPGIVECRFVQGQYWLTDYVSMAPVTYE